MTDRDVAPSAFDFHPPTFYYLCLPFILAFAQKRYSPGSHPFPLASVSAAVTLSRISLGGGGPGGAPAGRGFDVSALTKGSGLMSSTAPLMMSNSSGEYPPPTMTALTSVPLVGLELSTLLPKPEAGLTDSPLRSLGSSLLASSPERHTWITDHSVSDVELESE